METADRLSFKGRRGKQRPLAEKFWERVIKSAGCWTWQGSHNEHGYPKMGSSRAKHDPIQKLLPYGMLRVSRISWVIHRGKIPSGMSVLHKCDNPGCVNPDHLFLGTQAENMRDMRAKNRHRKPNRKFNAAGEVICLRGHVKELLPNETDKYVCRVCNAEHHKRYVREYKAGVRASINSARKHT